MPRSLSFAALRDANGRRQTEYSGCHNWQAVDWSNAMAGEVGEVCNKVKKLKRDGLKIDLEAAIDELGKEIADVVIYADILADFLGLDLGELVRAKFNEVSDRIGSEVKLPIL